MRWRQVIILYAVLAALGLEYWFVELRRGPEPVDAPRSRFMAFAPETVRELRLARGGRRVVSRREGDTWTVVEPSNAPIPGDLIAAFANALAAAEEIARVGGPEARAADFGLDEGAARIELVSDGGEPLRVTLGGVNPSGTGIYARRGDAADIVLIGRQVRYYEDLIFQAVSAGQAPAAVEGAPVGG